MGFPDHHAYDLKDINKILEQFDRLPDGQKFIFTTEKDAIRFQKFHNIAHQTQDAWYFLPVRIGFSQKTEGDIRKQIAHHVRKDQ